MAEDANDDEEEKYSTVVKMEEDDYDPDAEVDSKDWCDGSDFLPAGWMYKTVHVHTADYNKLLSPDGKVFNTKLMKALDGLFRVSHPVGRLAAVKQGAIDKTALGGFLHQPLKSIQRQFQPLRVTLFALTGGDIDAPTIVCQ